jgi:hypothetical protein
LPKFEAFVDDCDVFLGAIVERGEVRFSKIFHQEALLIEDPAKYSVKFFANHDWKKNSLFRVDSCPSKVDK